MYQIYTSVAPKPEDWPKLVTKTNALLSTRPYDLTAEVAALPMPVLIILGDADSISPAHAAEMFALLGGGKQDAGWDGSQRPPSQLAILPGTTHYDAFMRVDLLLPCIVPFLDPPSESK
jgi:pimeloyl-ACP methyl ester carboxylesterase